MLRALVEHAIRPDLIVGCSVGALNGVAFAQEPSRVGVARLEQLWQGLDGREVMRSGWLPTAVQLARKGTSIHDNDGLRRTIESVLSVARFEELPVQFQCVATDLVGAREVWFSEGELVEAILASAALPSVYPPVEIDGTRFIDGAVVNDVPVSRAVELGARKLYVLHVGSFDRPQPEPKRPLDLAVQAYWIARRHRFHRDLATLPRNVEAVVLPTGEPPRIRFDDFTRSRELIDAAYSASSAHLDSVATEIAAARSPG
jgi:NTE family protein